MSALNLEQKPECPNPFSIGKVEDTRLHPESSSLECAYDSESTSLGRQWNQARPAILDGTSSASIETLFGGMYDDAPRDGRQSAARLPSLLENDTEYQCVASQIGAAEHGAARVERSTRTKLLGKDAKVKKAATPEMTGIGSSLAVGRFVSAAKAIQIAWVTLTPEKRSQLLAEAANAELQRVGVVRVEPMIADLGGPDGEFDAEHWAMKLKRTPFERTELGEGEAGKLADVVFHEARHAEQHYRAAQLLASQHKDADEIAEDLGIPKDIAATAVKSAKRNPLDTSSAEGEEAQLFYDSLSGKDADHRVQVIQDKEQRKQERKDAEDAYVAINDDPKATPQQKAAAEQAWQQSRKALKEASKQYRALPEEVDAWKVGAAVTSAYEEQK